MDTTNLSDRTRGVALPVAVLLGVFGAHRFYVGKTGTGLLMLGTLGGMGLWWLYDLILIAAGEFRDANGRRVVRWSASDPGPEPRRLPTDSTAVVEELDALRTDVAELAERVDFMERLLTQARERGSLPPR
ncbi:MAG: TM2 domain-containing protein [Gemmatimonadetes bacterium]|nr:TM2 domain-containing protein [Gemmatimonadota bacterium]MBI2537876.1 TM2 domain-containing protein [Gemmatimonadota bacterium]